MSHQLQIANRKSQIPPTPTFAFLAYTSGAYEGAIIRDLRLANELHRRGYKVLIYWMLESNRAMVDPGIPQRVLCTGVRYQTARPNGALDFLARSLRGIPHSWRRRWAMAHPAYVQNILTNCCRAVCDGDPAVERRLARLIARDGVTHLLPTFAMICPFAQAANAMGGRPFEYLVTFQGEEIFANFAKRLGRLDDYHRRLRETMTGSPWPAVAVSHDYVKRLVDEMGLDETRMSVIYPGIELPAKTPIDAAADARTLAALCPGLRDDLPVVTYLGRKDAEKGIDLMLYAVKILRQRGLEFQLVCAGDVSFGGTYQEACRQIAEHLRVEAFWLHRVSNDVRTALYRHSRCIVYPSIHREPFGMVAAEAMSYGTPVLVPDIGGITEVVNVGGKCGGLTFKTWDSGNLAEQLGRLLGDEELHARLAADTQAVAENFTVARMADAVLAHIGVGPPGKN